MGRSFIDELHEMEGAIQQAIAENKLELDELAEMLKQLEVVIVRAAKIRSVAFKTFVVQLYDYLGEYLERHKDDR